MLRDENFEKFCELISNHDEKSIRLYYNDHLPPLEMPGMQNQPLHLAFLRASPQIFNLLLELGADPNHPLDASGNRLLHWAAVHVNADSPQLSTLLKHRKTHFYLLNQSQLSPFCHAARWGNNFMIGKLLEAGINKDNNLALRIAIENGHINIVQQLLESIYTHVNELGGHDISPLSIACQRTQHDIAHLLLRFGADPTLGHPSALEITSQNKDEGLAFLLQNYQSLIPRARGHHQTFHNTGLHYSREIFIDFIDNEFVVRTGRLVYRRKQLKRPNNARAIIKGEDFLSGLTTLSLEPDESVRIYINAHCRPSESYLYDKRGRPISFDTLSSLLAPLVQNRKASINIIACGAGMGEDSNSFAAKLHHSLSLKIEGESCPDVIARMQLSFTYWLPYPGRKATLALDQPYDCSWWHAYRHYKHRQPGSKMVFTLDSIGNQIKLDAYAYKWKFDIIKEITKLISQAVNESIRAELTDWHDLFHSSITPKNIFDCLQYELQQAESPISMALLESSQPQPFFFTRHRHPLLQLMREGERLFSSPHTPHVPQPTGIKLIKKT